MPTAIAALRTLDADGRKLAVEVLGGVPDARGAEALASALSDEDPNVRQAAAEALGSSAMGGDDARKIAVKALKSVLPRAEPMMKLAALGALSRIGVPHDWKVLAPLTHDPMLRTEALAAAAKCADPSAGVALVDALFDANVAHARTALIALAEWIEAAMRQALPIDDVAARLQSKQAGERAREIAEGDPESRGPVAHGARRSSGTRRPRRRSCAGCSIRCSRAPPRRPSRSSARPRFPRCSRWANASRLRVTRRCSSSCRR